MQKLKYLKDIEAITCLLLVAMEFTRPEIKKMISDDIPNNKKLSDFAKYELLKFLNPNIIQD
jgi:hypothetical protein